MSFRDDTTESLPGGEEGPQGSKLNGVLLKELEANFPQATADVMALVLEGVRALFSSEAADTATKISDSAVPGPEERRPPALVVHCGGGESVLAAEEVLKVLAATDADWKAMDYVRVNQIGKGVRLVRKTPEDGVSIILWRKCNQR